MPVFGNVFLNHEEDKWYAVCGAKLLGPFDSYEAADKEWYAQIEENRRIERLPPNCS